MNEYLVQLPGNNTNHVIHADAEIHDKEFGFLLLYVEGSLVARVPKEALIIRTGKLHK